MDTFFVNSLPDESEVDRIIDKISKLNELKSNITTEKSKLEILKNVQASSSSQNKGVQGTGLFIMASVIMVLGIIMMFVAPFAGIGFLTAGIVLFIVARSKKKKQQSEAISDSGYTTGEQHNSNMDIQRFIEDLTAQRGFLEDEINNFLLKFSAEINSNNYYSALTNVKTKASEYKNIMAKLDNKESAAIKAMQDDIIRDIDAYLEPYCDDLAVLVEQKDLKLKELKNNRIEYLNIFGKLSKYERTNARFEALNNELFRILNTYFKEIDDNPITNVNILKEKHKDYLRLTKQLENYKAKKEQFEKENDVEAFKNINVPKHNLKELQDSERALDSELERITDEENNAKKQITDLSDDAVRCPDIQAEIEQLKEELSIGKNRLDILNETTKCLENAENKFAGHYMDNMNKGFEQYVNMLDNGTLGETHMDVKLNVSITEYGSQKSLDCFSTGYKDLIGICTRFALVDALFENEKPFIILDDPFVNLDREAEQST